MVRFLTRRTVVALVGAQLLGLAAWASAGDRTADEARPRVEHHLTEAGNLATRRTGSAAPAGLPCLDAAQESPCSEEPRHNRAQRNREDLGDLLVRKAPDVSEHERLAVRQRQSSQGLSNFAERRFLEDRCPGSGLPLRPRSRSDATPPGRDRRDARARRPRIGESGRG
jgi:hypothetical protein